MVVVATVMVLARWTIVVDQQPALELWSGADGDGGGGVGF